MEIRGSVRAFVEFLLRAGSLESGFSGTDRALEGARMHRQLQQAYGENAQAEVPLSLAVPRGDFIYILEGRADGIFWEKGRAVVDEIKSTDFPVEKITEDRNPLHWTQAQCYAYIYAREQNLPEIEIQLTYIQYETKEIRRFRRLYPYGELEEFYFSLLDRYERWAKFTRDWAGIRDASLCGLQFPFSRYRPGQREMAAAVYRTIANRARLFCQAPTGIGKTLAALFPAVKAFGEGKTDRIFYLTAKTIARQMAQDAFSQMREGGMRLKTITLTAKEKICFQKECDCTAEKCPYANGYYDRANDALYELLYRADGLTREVIEEAARANRVCPFELALDAALWCDAIICDYNYLFDPVVYLRRFFGGKTGQYTFLVDEAHNLVQRAREMYTARLWKSRFLEGKRKLGKDKLARAFGKVNQAFLDLRKEGGKSAEQTLERLPEQCKARLEHFTAACGEWFEQQQEHPLREEVLSVFFEVQFFLKIAELLDEHFIVTVVTQGKEVLLSILCLDPSALLDETMKRGAAAVLFSATLSPAAYYRAVLGGGETAKSYTLQSPFPAENFLLLAAGQISVKYTDRQASIAPIAEMIHTVITAKKGNYLIYFPSYQYRDEVYEVFAARYPSVETLLQTGGMREESRTMFLNRFQIQEETLVGFCVLGGIFAEGIDLPGERLIGSVIVGVGLPKIEREQELLRAYYDRINGEGFAFAYQFPGMNKVLQAAGRVIRSETDRGVVLLIDSRFATPLYQALFPAHWQHLRYIGDQEELSGKLRDFWARDLPDGQKNLNADD